VLLGSFSSNISVSSELATSWEICSGSLGGVVRVSSISCFSTGVFWVFVAMKSLDAKADVSFYFLKTAMKKPPVFWS
jgi:hypothetical protein